MGFDATRATLVEKLANQQDEKSWEEFVSYYRGYLSSVIKQQGFSYEDTEDLVQSVLVKSWKAIPNFVYDSQRCKFRSWLTIITKNTIKDYLKSKQKKLKDLIAEKTSDELEAYLNDEVAEIEKIAEIEWKEYISRLAWKSIKTDFDQKVIDTFQKYIEGVSIKEIASTFEMKENTVYVYKGRVQKALMKEILRLDTLLG